MKNAAVVPFDSQLLAQKWEYYGGKCWMCGEDACEWDHVKPLSKGGSHILANLRPACRRCNASKAAKWPIMTFVNANSAVAGIVAVAEPVTLVA